MNSQGLYDDGYTNLLSILRDSATRIPLETVCAGISHYLAQATIGTALAASAISSPLWQRPDRKSLLSLANAFSNAATLKANALQKRKRGIFEASESSELVRWVRSILDGLEGGTPPLQASASLGLLAGISASEKGEKKMLRLRWDMEHIALLAVAEIMEASSLRAEWEREFSKGSQNTSEDLFEPTVTVLACFQSHISGEALSLLSLYNLAEKLSEIVVKTFERGTFLGGMSDEFKKGRDRITNKENADLHLKVTAVHASDRYADVAVISRLLARTISTITDNTKSLRRRTDTWKLLVRVADTLQVTCQQVERDWGSSSLASVSSEHDTVDDDLGRQTWGILKTLLFSTLMIHQALLDALLYLYPLPPSTSVELKAPNVTRKILQALSALSMVIDAFGGVSSTDGSGAGSSFPELKKVFYMAIDIMAVDAPASEGLVQELIIDSEQAAAPYQKAKRTFVLACVEQLVPILDNRTLQTHVVPLCEPHLTDSSLRETFEASHSVMLSIFAAHADKAANDTCPNPDARTARNSVFIRRLVPGYCQYLLESAKEDGLTTAQLRLAYAALVRSTSAKRTSEGRHSSAKDRIHRAAHLDRRAGDAISEGAALTWLCIDQLLLRIASCNGNSHAKRRQALRLTLISLVSNVSLELLPNLFQAVEDTVMATDSQTYREELIQSLHDELLERVGDREREFSLTWWFGFCKKLSGVDGDTTVIGKTSYTNNKTQVQSHL